MHATDLEESELNDALNDLEKACKGHSRAYDDELLDALGEVKDSANVLADKSRDYLSASKEQINDLLGIIEDIAGIAAEALETVGAFKLKTDAPNDMVVWVQEHTPEHRFYEFRKVCFVHLPNEVDQVMFKLRWSDLLES